MAAEIAQAFGGSGEKGSEADSPQEALDLLGMLSGSDEPGEVPSSGGRHDRGGHPGPQGFFWGGPFSEN